jgi:hypothetical protein
LSIRSYLAQFNMISTNHPFAKMPFRNQRQLFTFVHSGLHAKQVHLRVALTGWLRVIGGGVHEAINTDCWVRAAYCPSMTWRIEFRYDTYPTKPSTAAQLHSSNSWQSACRHFCLPICSSCVREQQRTTLPDAARHRWCTEIAPRSFGPTRTVALVLPTEMPDRLRCANVALRVCSKP